MDTSASFDSGLSSSRSNGKVIFFPDGKTFRRLYPATRAGGHLDEYLQGRESPAAALLFGSVRSEEFIVPEAAHVEVRRGDRWSSIFARSGVRFAISRIGRNRGRRYWLTHPYIVSGRRFREIYYWDPISPCSVCERAAMRRD